jgi:6-pyruvoyltetrahydropterin/6-carboxytetrahydropterin synthase
MKIIAHRYHDFNYGHRVHGHEGKCAHLHGHSGRVTFYCLASEGLDSVGRVIDFSVIKSKLCMWVEDAWDHKFLAWDNDPYMRSIQAMSEQGKADKVSSSAETMLRESIIWVPFNPTAENMASHLLNFVGPILLADLNVTLVRVDLMETRKCGVTVQL